MDQVVRPVTDKCLVEQGDTFIEHDYRMINLSQFLQAAASASRDLGRAHPVQPRWIVVPIQALDFGPPIAALHREVSPMLAKA